MSEVQFCIKERPQLFEFEVATCRTCRLRFIKAILEVATSNLQKWWGFAQWWCPCMLIWHPLMYVIAYHFEIVKAAALSFCTHFLCKFSLVSKYYFSDISRIESYTCAALQHGFRLRSRSLHMSQARLCYVL